MMPVKGCCNLISHCSAVAALLCASAIGAISGCASDHIPSTGPVRTVSVQSFSAAKAGQSDSESSVAARGTPLSSSASTLPAVKGSEGADAHTEPQLAATPTPQAAANPTTAQFSPPARVTSRLVNPGDETIVESVVGQVSGRPIFVDAFLEPIADQLKREGERLSQAEFLQQAQAIIGKRLTEVVLNELVLAEAEASLTQEEQFGLLALLRDMQEKTIAEAGGSLFAAKKKVIEEQEMTLAEFEEAQKNATLIQKLLYERIEPRVIVSWRDVQREYELRKAEFNPPASVTLLRLQLDDTEQAALIEQAKTMLGDGKTFNDVVKLLSLEEFVSTVGGGPMLMGPGGISDVGVIDIFKPALAKLKGEEGETTEVILRQGRTVWLYVEKIEQPPRRTLFDVQTQLIAELRARRVTEEREKYVRSLYQKGIYDELETMARRVLMVAILRYGP